MRGVSARLWAAGRERQPECGAALKRIRKDAGPKIRFPAASEGDFFRRRRHNAEAAGAVYKGVGNDVLKEIVADINPYQTRIVLLENSVPTEFYLERRGKERLVGNIYKGRVQNVLPGMQAAFVDIGLERNAFLYAGDINTDVQYYELSEGAKPEISNIKDIVKSGQEILVQVLKDPAGTKGARITTHITLPGTSLVLMPTVDYIGVSRRIEGEAERMRLKRMISEIKPEGLGLIVRTAGEGKVKEDFIGDVEFLTKQWGLIREKAGRVTAPRLVRAEEPLLFRVIRDVFSPDVDRLVVNDREFCEKIKAIVGITSPAMMGRVIFNEKCQPVRCVWAGKVRR